MEYIVEFLKFWYTWPFTTQFGPWICLGAWTLQTPVLVTWWRSEFPADEKVLGLPCI